MDKEARYLISDIAKATGGVAKNLSSPNLTSKELKTLSQTLKVLASATNTMSKTWDRSTKS